jgi:hypothetical protein
VKREREFNYSKFRYELAQYIKVTQLDEVDKRLLRGFYTSDSRKIERKDDRELNHEDAKLLKEAIVEKQTNTKTEKPVKNIVKQKFKMGILKKVE